MSAAPIDHFPITQEPDDGNSQNASLNIPRRGSGFHRLQSDDARAIRPAADQSRTHALDLTTLGKDNTAACSQALHDVTSRTDRAIIRAAAGAQAHKGGKVSDTQAFKSARLAWIDNK